MDDAQIREALVRHWEFAGNNEDKSHEIYHDDAVLEFPQSGERFLGKQNFLTWRKTYPAKLDFRIRRMTGGADVWVAENPHLLRWAAVDVHRQRPTVPR